MAKICFLTDRLPNDPDPFSALIWNQFRSLADSQFEVLIVCQRAPQDMERWQHNRLQIIEPFPNFSMRYLPRFLQVLAGHKPDILHWVEPREKRLNHLQWLTPALATLRKRPLLATSLWHVNHWEKNWLLAGTLPTMDLLFVTHPLQREMLWRRWPRIMSRVMVAPLIFSETSPSSHWLTNWANEFDFVPGDIEDLIGVEETLDALTRSLTPNPDRKAVFATSDRTSRFTLLERLRDRNLDGRVAVLENLDWPTWNELFSRARQIRTDLLLPDSPHLALAIEWSRARGKSIPLSDSQVSLMHELQFPDANNFLARAYHAAFKEANPKVN